VVSGFRTEGDEPVSRELVRGRTRLLMPVGEAARAWAGIEPVTFEE